MLSGSDVDGDPLTFALVDLPAHGMASIADSVLTYTPDPQYNGSDVLTFSTSDGQLSSDPATVSLTIVPVNDAPTANAGADSIVVESTGLLTSVQLNGSASFDVDGDSLLFSWSAEGVTFDSAQAITPTGQFSVGVTPVTLQVADPSGALSTATVVVHVQDTTPPALYYDQIALVLWPPNQEMHTVLENIYAVDQGDVAIDVHVEVTSNEPIEGEEEESDWSATPNAEQTASVDLRAERSGTGDDRIYCIALSATDGSGNTTVDTVEVTVPHDQRSAKRAGTPLVTTLFPNYPNPFNASTQLSFFLPAESAVTFEIYSVLGTKVRTLEIPHLYAGYHQITWDARGDDGRTVASGLYIYRMRAGDAVETRRMLLLK